MVAIPLAGSLVPFSPVSALPEVDQLTIQVVTHYPAPVRCGDVRHHPPAGASVWSDVWPEADVLPELGRRPRSSRFNSSSSCLLDVAEQEVQAAINAATNLLLIDLPNPPVLAQPGRSLIMTLAVTSAILPMTQVEDMVETRVAQKISQVTGVGLVTLTRGQRPLYCALAQCPPLPLRVNQRNLSHRHQQRQR